MSYWRISFYIPVLSISAFSILILSGCATQNSTNAKPLNIGGKGLNLKSFSMVTVKPFEYKAKNSEYSQVGQEFAEKISHRLKNDFGSLFSKVSVGKPLESKNELIVTGKILNYHPRKKSKGNKKHKVGIVTFRAELILKKGDTGEVIFSAPITKLWAWGGTLGAKKRIEDMVKESAAASANTIARGKGWRPATEFKNTATVKRGV